MRSSTFTSDTDTDAASFFAAISDTTGAGASTGFTSEGAQWGGQGNSNFLDALGFFRCLVPLLPRAHPQEWCSRVMQPSLLHWFGRVDSDTPTFYNSSAECHSLFWVHAGSRGSRCLFVASASSSWPSFLMIPRVALFDPMVGCTPPTR